MLLFLIVKFSYQYCSQMSALYLLLSKADGRWHLLCAQLGRGPRKTVVNRTDDWLSEILLHWGKH